MASIADEIRELHPSVRILAVSKGHPVDIITEKCKLLSLDHLGENYVQELVDKSGQISNVNWHFIGRLQGNKIGSLLRIPELWAIETVDSREHAEQIEKECTKLNRTIRVFIQVDISGDKGGIPIESTTELVSKVRNLSHINLVGLMCIGTAGSASEFTRMRELRDSIDPSLELSMGMSGDWREAIKAGSTEVRIGTAIFGDRTYSK